jgi:hypothetical protein
MCSAPKPATIASGLGAELMPIVVDWYRKDDWRTFDTVKDYLERILVAPPEVLDRIPWWANAPEVEIAASAEFKGGNKARMEFGNGYAHFQDRSGCEWWSRYLGASNWVIRR